MGSIDKTIGVLVAVIIGVLYFTNVINGTLALVLGAFAIVFLITSFTDFCPLSNQNVLLSYNRIH